MLGLSSAHRRQCFGLTQPLSRPNQSRIRVAHQHLVPEQIEAGEAEHLDGEEGVDQTQNAPSRRSRARSASASS
jgi:hypothetical protein